MNGFLNGLIERKVSSRNLAIFRILYSVVLLLEVIRLYRFKELVYDSMPFLEPSVIAVPFAFYAWILSILCLILGYKTRFFASINYLLSLLMIGAAKHFEYHAFHGYMGVNFLLMIAPVSSALSIDNLLKRINNSKTKANYIPDEMVSEYYAYLFVFMGAGLVYLDSVFYKIQSPLWINGLGVWLPASMPFAVNFNATPILNIEWLMKGLGYLTLVFEAFFIFLFWNKRFKLLFFIVGIGLHIGIYLLYPIPQFAQLVITFYVLLLPPFLIKSRTRLTDRAEYFVFYNAENPFCIRAKIVFEYFDIFGRIKLIDSKAKKDEENKIPRDALNKNILGVYEGKVYTGIDVYIQYFRYSLIFYPFFLILKVPGVYQIARWLHGKLTLTFGIDSNTEKDFEIRLGAPESNNEQVMLFNNLSMTRLYRVSLKLLFVVIILLQLITSLKSPLISNRFKGVSWFRSLNIRLQPVASVSTYMFGITNHGLFMDSHFKNYNHIIRIDCIENGKRTVLPIITEQGLPGDYLKNFVWANWTFCVNGPNISNRAMETGIKKYTLYWLYKTNRIHAINQNHEFEILCKKIDIPSSFEPDFLNRQIAKPWFVIGNAEWHGNDFSSSILPIEEQ